MQNALLEGPGHTHQQALPHVDTDKFERSTYRTALLRRMSQKLAHFHPRCGFLAYDDHRDAKLNIRELLPLAPQPADRVRTPNRCDATEPEHAAAPTTTEECQPTCPECGGQMEIVETLAKRRHPVALTGSIRYQPQKRSWECDANDNASCAEKCRDPACPKGPS